MPRYLCMQRRLPGGDGEKPSPSQMQEMYAKFGAWKEKFRDNLIDMGGRLGAGRLVTMESAADGPFVEVKELVGGYMIADWWSTSSGTNTGGSSRRSRAG